MLAVPGFDLTSQIAVARQNLADQGNWDYHRQECKEVGMVHRCNRWEEQTVCLSYPKAADRIWYHCLMNLHQHLERKPY
jgi:hypothetical protein